MIVFYLSRFLPQDLYNNISIEDFSPQCAIKNTIAVILQQKLKKQILQNFAEPN